MQLTEENLRDIHCYTCGHDHTFVLRQIDEPVSEGTNTVIVTMIIGVCSYCGNRIMDTPTAVRLQDVRKQLKDGKIVDFIPVGVTYRSAS